MTDREIVEEILTKGRTQCYAEIVRQYSGLVYSKALSVTKREELASEVAQQTFVKAYEQLALWCGQQMGPWLVICAPPLKHIRRSLLEAADALYAYVKILLSIGNSEFLVGG